MNAVDSNKGYNPQEVEKKWYDFWEKKQLFEASEKKAERNFSIVIPPPNITGVLHIGHALDNTLQDILCRYHRLMGDNVLWMPGTDHAGIATQNVVERKLAEQGLSRHELGREKFVEKVWQWREEYGNAIINQLKRLGSSCDWKRERFTMDEGLSLAVRTVFVKLYEQSLIYQGDYIINWCNRCNTALADLEVEHKEHNGFLYYIKYKFADKDDGIVVATTRPETMFGDTAVAIHPNDERYNDIDAEQVILPLLDKAIPIIRDKYVDISFGSGALKITPAHDPNDFEIAVKHNLKAIKVIDDNGMMTSDAGRFEGLERFECRQQVVEELKKQGLLVKTEDYKHSIGHCYRCGDIIEPNLSKQWFVKTKPLAQKAIDAVKNRETRIIPVSWTKTYFEWMENIKDWCISRQIWWGHRIPAWTCNKCGKLTVAIQTPLTCPSCGQDSLSQETDVLDTWFSSALWPFSTMGWPRQTELLKTFYPTSVLVTGFDILFFWVARMMMMGIHFMEDVPFKNVYVHALVRDAHGKKMSKSTGNVIDPLTIIDTYGTDSFRMTLAAFAAQGRDIKMSEKRIQGYRNFINKLWNASRFALTHLKEELTTTQIDFESLWLPDSWIISGLDNTAKAVSEAIENYKFNDAASALYQFVWHELCDWYLEIIKPVLYGNIRQERRNSTLTVLFHVLSNTLILLHPFIPFITEEIWHKLPGTKSSIMTASWYSPDKKRKKLNEKAQTDMSLIRGIVTGIRNIRGEMNISLSLELDAIIVQSADESKIELIQEYKDIIINLAKLKSLLIQETGKEPDSSATAVVDGAVIFVPLEGIIDFDKEIARLEKEIAKTAKDLEVVVKKMNNEDFLSKAPADVIEKVKTKNDDLAEKQEKLQKTIHKIKRLIPSD